MATGTGFTAVLLGGSVTILYLFLLNAAFRGAGDAAVALRSLWLANGLNIILDPCLIFGLGPFPEMGVTGAAGATTNGGGTGGFFSTWYLFDGRGRLPFQLFHFRVLFREEFGRKAKKMLELKTSPRPSQPAPATGS